MRQFTTIAEARGFLDGERCAGRSVGLVPTMGALHAGHASLVRRAAADNETVAITIFVNPLQFGPNEDFDSYPRTLEADLALAETEGATVAITPTVKEMYPDRPVRTNVAVAGITAPMEGARRPGHFDGVSTVVTKLFNIAGPCHAYFGEKDWQQLAVISRMVRDLSFPVTIVPCPTVREADGLAMSSRNVYLTEDERAAAPSLHRALTAGVEAIERGERDPKKVTAIVRSLIDPIADVDYVEVVDAATLEDVVPLAGVLRLLVAARFGKARLIDNVGVTVR
ncbi:MAG: pantoate--beta-alanine ligase [Acidimicrobiia bacterium]